MPGAPLPNKNVILFGAGAAVVLLGVAYFVGRHLWNTGAIDPTSDKNVAYTGVNAVGAVLTGDKDFSLGSAIYDWFHPFEANYSGDVVVGKKPEDIL